VLPAEASGNASHTNSKAWHGAAANMTADLASEAVQQQVDHAWADEAVKRGVAHAKAGEPDLTSNKFPSLMDSMLCAGSGWLTMYKQVALWRWYIHATLLFDPASVHTLYSALHKSGRACFLALNLS